MIVLYPDEVKHQLGSLRAARAVELAREAMGKRLYATPDLDMLICAVDQVEPGRLPLRRPHRFLGDGTEVWLATVGRY